MRKIALILCLLSWTATFLLAEEFVIRPADRLTLGEFGFQTSSGDWLVFFTDHSGLTQRIYYYKISAAGMPLTDEAASLADKDTDQKLINLVPTSDGNFILVWQEVSNQGHLYMQKLNSDCQALWGSGGVKCLDSPSEPYMYKMMANDAGGITVISQTEYWNTPIWAQNFDSAGNKLWGEDGVVLVGSDVSSAIGDLVSYPGGGFLLRFWMRNGYHYTCEVWRYSESGVLVDNNSLVPTDLFMKNIAPLIGPVNGEYLIYGGYDSMLEINKVSTDGELLLEHNLVYTGGTMRDIKLLSDGRVVFVANYGNVYGEGETIRMYMLSPQLEQLWVVEEQIPSYQPPRISVCPDEKILLTWRRTSQLYDASGTRLFSEPKVVSGDGGYDTLILPGNDRALFLWNYVYNTEQRIKLQGLNLDGSLVHLPNGVILEMRLAGICPDDYYYYWRPGENHCFTFGDRFLSIWTDTRGGEHFYYQLFDQDMQPLLEPNGRAVHTSNIEFPTLLQNYIGADNKFYLSFKPKYGGMTYLQAIDYDGNLCYAGNGLELGESECVVGNVENVTYVFWTKQVGGRSDWIMGQKYVNGQAQWGVNGERVLSHVFNHRYKLLGFENNMLIYSDTFDTYEQVGPAFLKALRFDNSGLVIPAGGDGIITLCSEPVSLANPLIAKGRLGDELCLIIRRESEETTQSYILQKVDYQGYLPWGLAGISFNEDGDIRHAVFGNNAVSFLSLEAAGYAFHSVDAGGNIQTPYGGVNVIPAAYTVKDVDFAAFADGTLICAFSSGGDDSDIYVRRIAADGRSADAAPVLLCDARNIQSQPRIATVANKGLITWKDHRAGVEVTGLWANSVRSSTPNDDALQTPVTQVQIIGNYPNPFNPSTTISYNIAVDGMAKLEVYNIKGQLVKTLVNEPKLMGKHQVVWDGKDFRGKGMASGIFFVRLSSAGKSSRHKMVLVK